MLLIWVVGGGIGEKMDMVPLLSPVKSTHSLSTITELGSEATKETALKEQADY